MYMYTLQWFLNFIRNILYLYIASNQNSWIEKNLYHSRSHWTMKMRSMATDISQTEPSGFEASAYKIYLTRYDLSGTSIFKTFWNIKGPLWQISNSLSLILVVFCAICHHGQRQDKNIWSWVSLLICQRSRSNVC